MDYSMPQAHELAELTMNLSNYPSSTKIYFHCANGHGRSAAAAICLLVYRKSVMSVEEAINIIKAHRKVKMNENQRRIMEKALEYCE